MARTFSADQSAHEKAGFDQLMEDRRADEAAPPGDEDGGSAFHNGTPFDANAKLFDPKRIENLPNPQVKAG